MNYTRSFISTLSVVVLSASFSGSVLAQSSSSASNVDACLTKFRSDIAASTATAQVDIAYLNLQECIKVVANQTTTPTPAIDQPADSQAGNESAGGGNATGNTKYRKVTAEAVQKSSAARAAAQRAYEANKNYESYLLYTTEVLSYRQLLFARYGYVYGDCLKNDTGSDLLNKDGSNIRKIKDAFDSVLFTHLPSLIKSIKESKDVSTLQSLNQRHIAGQYEVIQNSVHRYCESANLSVKLDKLKKLLEKNSKDGKLSDVATQQFATGQALVKEIQKMSVDSVDLYTKKDFASAKANLVIALKKLNEVRGIVAQIAKEVRAVVAAVQGDKTQVESITSSAELVTTQLLASPVLFVNEQMNVALQSVIKNPCQAGFMVFVCFFN